MKHRFASFARSGRLWQEMMIFVALLGPWWPLQAANLAPKISFVQPVNGETFVNAAGVPIAVQTEDADGFIRTVEVFSERGLLCAWVFEAASKDPITILQWSWTNAPVGEHKLVAEATDNEGTSSSSEPVVFTVKRLPDPARPVVSIEATVPDTAEPAPNVRVQPGVFTLKRTGDMSRALTVFLAYDGSATAGSDYQILPAVVVIPENISEFPLLVQPEEDRIPEGIESVVATLIEPPFDRLPEFTIDAQHNTAKILIHDNGLGPGARVEITSPSDGQVFTEGDLVRLTAVAVEPAGAFTKVQFYDFETLLNLPQTQLGQPGPGSQVVYQVEWYVAPVGEHLVTARAVDSQGNPVRSSAVRFQVLPRGSLPVVSIVSLDPEATEYPPMMSYRDTARFSISREGDLSQAMYVVFSLHGTAQPGTDYPYPGRVYLPAGQREAVIEIEPLSDDLAEPMETIALRLEDPMPISSLPGPPVPYAIAPNAPAAAAVIYDGTRPSAGLLQLALPDNGEVFLDSQGIDAIAAAYHPTLDVMEAELYADGSLVSTSSLSFVKLKPGGAVMHLLRWKYPIPGTHVLTARARVPDGTVLISDKVQVTVRSSAPSFNNPPTVALVRPSSGSVFTAGDKVEVVAAAQDSDGTIKEITLLADDQVIAQSPSADLAFQWPAAVGTHSLVARAIDNRGALGESVPVKILVREPDAVAFVRRHLPPGYIAGRSLTVTLQAEPPLGCGAYAVEDRPPAGWAIGEINEDGVFDAITGRVKFGVFADGKIRTLTYTVTPKADASGAQEFAGDSACDGKRLPISGDSQVMPTEERHPADQDPPDFVIDIRELTAYAAAWKQGQPWPEGPVPIPVAYITRAAQIWKAGEKYRYDPAQGSPPLCWKSFGPIMGLANSGWADGVVREMSCSAEPGQPVLVTIRLTVGNSVSACAFEEQLPAGWTAQDISEEGIFDPKARCIRWGVFMDQETRTLSYRALPAPAGAGSLRGILSCDGTREPLSATPQLRSDTGWPEPRFQRVERGADGEVRLTLTGPAELLSIIETSSDLASWVQLATVFLPDGVMIYQDHSARGPTQKFYRARVP